MPDLGSGGCFQGQLGLPGTYLPHITIAIILNICHLPDLNHCQKQRQNGVLPVVY